MPHQTPLIALLSIGFVVAFVLGSLAHRLRLSPIVGYLIAGVIVGPFTPGFDADVDLAMELSEIGVILLMFGVGLHFSVEDLLEVKAIAIPGALAQIAVATGMGWGLAYFLGWPLMQGLVFGLALSVASTVVLLRELEDRRQLESRRGRIAIGWLIVQDLLMVLALVMLPALAGALGGTQEGGEPATVGTITVALVWTLIKVAAFVTLMMVVGGRAIPWLLERVAGFGTRELFTLAVLAIALGVAFGSAKLFGVSFALGAFFAGMLLNGDLSHKAASDSLPLRDAFAVLFFVSIGMLFDPRILIEQPLSVLATFAIITVGKSIAAYAVVRAFKHTHATALMISASLAQIGEFSFILASLSVALKILPPEGRDLILAGALLSIVANPLILVFLDAREKRLAKADTASPAAASAAGRLEIPPGGHAILIGYGRVGSEIARLLHERAVPLVVIDDDLALVRKARIAGFAAIRGNAASPRVIDEADPATAKLVVLAIPEPLEAGEVVARLRAINPGLTILARAHSEGEVRHLLAHGADGAVLAEKELAHSMAEMALSAPPFRELRSPA